MSIHHLNDKDRLFQKEQRRIKDLQRELEERPMTDVEIEIMGGASVRLDFVIAEVDLHTIAKYADLMEGIATYIRFTAGRRELSVRERKTAIANEFRAMRIRLRHLAGREKFNKNGTVKR